MKKQRLVLHLLLPLILVVLASCSAPAAPPQAAAPTPAPPTASPVATALPRPLLIVDADMGVPDVMALLYLLQHPDVDVAAITVAGTGDAHCEPGCDTRSDSSP
jgi:hypothetical protein